MNQHISSGDELLKVLSVLANPHRLRILSALTGGRNYVSQLARELGISRPLLHMQLKRLEAAGLVAGLIFVVVSRSQPICTLLLGVAGAWMGLIIGAGCGLVVDVIAQTGDYLGIAGHLMAIPGSVISPFLFRARS